MMWKGTLNVNDSLRSIALCSSLWKLTPIYPVSTYLLRMLSYTIVRNVTQSWHGESAIRNPHIRSHVVLSMSSVRKIWTSLLRKESYITFRKLKTTVNNSIGCVRSYSLKWKQLVVFIRIKTLYWMKNRCYYWFLSVIKDGLQLPFIRLPYVNKPISSITYQFFKICYFKEGDKPLTEVFSLPPDGMTLNNTYSNVYTEDSECIH